MAMYSFIKVSLLKTYITIYGYNITYFLKTYLDSSILYDDSNLEIPVYDLIRADHTSNSKLGDLCVCYRNSLLLKIMDIFYLQKCIVFQLKKISSKSFKIVSLYGSTSQFQGEFETFTGNFQLTLDKIFEANLFLVIELEDFNPRPSRWYGNEEKTTEGSKIANLTTQFGQQTSLLTYLTTYLAALADLSHHSLI